jgi:hypothetical protein
MLFVLTTYCDSLHGHMRVLVPQALGNGLEAVSGTITSGLDTIAKVHDEAPVLRGVLFIGDFICRRKNLENCPKIMALLGRKWVLTNILVERRGCGAKNVHFDQTKASEQLNLQND